MCIRVLLFGRPNMKDTVSDVWIVAFLLGGVESNYSMPDNTADSLLAIRVPSLVSGSYEAFIHALNTLSFIILI